MDPMDDGIGEQNPTECKLDTHITILDDPDHFPWVLTEDNIPGASLNGKDPRCLKVPELQFWLWCHGISVTGLNKSQLIATLLNTLSSQTKTTQLHDPDYPYYTDRKIQQLSMSSKLTPEIMERFPTLKPPMFPVYGWQNIQDCSTDLDIRSYLNVFTTAELYKYFEIMAKNRGTDLSFRTLSRGAKIFNAGFVKETIVCMQNAVISDTVISGLYMKSFVYASMRKETHEIKIQIRKFDPQHPDKVKITFAVCGCKAGLSGICGHISAVLHQLIECNRKKGQIYKCKTSDTCEKENAKVACTSQKNVWKPPKKKSVIPKTCIADYTFRKFTTIWEKQPTKSRKKRDYSEFVADPTLTAEKVASRIVNVVKKLEQSERICRIQTVLQAKYAKADDLNN